MLLLRKYLGEHLAVDASIDDADADVTKRWIQDVAEQLCLDSGIVLKKRRSIYQLGGIRRCLANPHRGWVILYVMFSMPLRSSSAAP